MLTHAAVKAARFGASPYKLTDERGLHLYVTPSQRKTWRLRFRFPDADGKLREQLMTIGQWPEISLDAARARAAAAHEQLGRGVDPRTAPAVMTFERAARAWHAQQLAGWTAVHAADVLRSLERDVFPAIGAEELDAIDAPAVLRIVRSIEERKTKEAKERGAIQTARRVRQRISDVFALAVSEGWAQADPAAIVGRALTRAPAARHHAALTTIKDAKALLAAAELVDAGAVVKLASRFLALTAVRLAAVRGARWDEIEDLDGAAPVWRVPAARVKLAAAKKLDKANDHLVPLAPAAVAVLRAARALSGRAGLIFPGRDGSSPLAENTINALYGRTRFGGRHVAHGWRATFSTVMNERRPDDRWIIDRALGHVLKREDDKGKIETAKVEGAYNRSQHLDLRRRVLEEWAAILTG